MRRRKEIFAWCLVLALVLSLASPAAEVSAARKTKTVSDSFDNRTLLGEYDTEIWSAYTNQPSIQTKELKKPGKVLEFTGKNVNGESTVLMSKEWYWEIHSLSFDVKIPAQASWFGLDFVDIDEPKDYVGDYAKQGEPMCYGSFKMSADDDFGIPGTDWTDWGFKNKKLSDVWVSVKVVSENDKSGKIYIAPKGQPFDKSKAKNITLGEGQSFYNSNVVFVDYMFSGYKLDNLVINTDTGVFKDNFENGKNDLFMGISIEKDTQKFSFPIVEDGAVRKLQFAKADAKDRLISNTAIEKEDKMLKASEEVMHASFTVDFTESKASEEIAYVFGLPEIDSDPFAGTWACVMNRNGGRIVQYKKDGTEKKGSRVTYKSSSAGEKAVTLSLTKDGTLKVTENGRQVLKCNGIKEYDGYMGFAAKTSISKAIYLDDVVISNLIYDIITTKTVSDDFKTNKLGTQGNSDYAYHAESGAITVSDEELVFDGCLDGTYFGSAYEYETYEMTFQLTSILGTRKDEERQNATAPDRWIGIDFGKQSATTKTYGTYGMFLIRITAPEGEKNWKVAETGLYKKEGTSTLEGEEFKVVKSIPASYFEDITYDGKTKQREDISADAAVCFKLVAEESGMKLYMKRADEKKYTLYVTLDHVNPAGWTSIACTGWTFWTIDNFKMKNTAKVYNEAPPVVVEEVATVSYEERGIGVEDTGWEEEQKLNADTSSSISPVIWIGGVAGIVVVVGIAGCILYSRKKKKNKITEEAEN